jgi:adenylate cyclase
LAWRHRLFDIATSFREGSWSWSPTVGGAARGEIGGQTIVQGDNLFGDAVNIAARLEALAEPGGICVSGTVQNHIGTKLTVGFIDLGEQQVKNTVEPIKAYRIRGKTSSTAIPVLGSLLPIPDKPSIAVLPFQNMSDDLEQEYFADGMSRRSPRHCPRFDGFS